MREKRTASLAASAVFDAGQEGASTAEQAGGSPQVPGHPGGVELTKRLLALSGIAPPARVLDVGAGTGRTVALLRGIGFDAVGIDREPSGDSILYGEICHGLSAGCLASAQQIRLADKPTQGIARSLTSCGSLIGDGKAVGCENDAIDAVIAECVLSISGDAAAALETAYALLKPGGKLLVSDVVFEGAGAPCLSLPEPATEPGWHRLVQEQGFSVVEYVDVSELWKDYYLRSLWAGQDVFCDREEGTAQTLHCGSNRSDAAARCGYMMMVCKKPARMTERR